MSSSGTPLTLEITGQVFNYCKATIEQVIGYKIEYRDPVERPLAHSREQAYDDAYLVSVKLNRKNG